MARIVLDVELDEDHVFAQAVKRGVLPDIIATEILAQLEGQAVDSVRWTDGVRPGNGIASRAEVTVAEDAGTAV